MSLAIVIPFRGGAADREANLEWTLARYRDTFPDAPVVFGSDDGTGPFNRSAAIVDGARQTDADVLVVTDGDCWTDAMPVVADAVRHGAPWSVAGVRLHRLSDGVTQVVLAGAEPNTSMKLAQDPYPAYECGVGFAISRDTLLEVPPDPRFVGWGGEERAWACALRTMVGPPVRIDAPRWPFWHLWHEPQPRKSRSVGSDENERLVKRYAKAKSKPDVMRALIDESREVTV